jgi:hypothetical protein
MVTGQQSTMMGLRCIIPARRAHQGSQCTASLAQIARHSVTCTEKWRRQCELKTCLSERTTPRLTGTLTHSGIRQLAFRQIETSITTSRRTQANGNSLSILTRRSSSRYRRSTRQICIVRLVCISLLPYSCGRDLTGRWRCCNFQTAAAHQGWTPGGSARARSTCRWLTGLKSIERLTRSRCVLPDLR